MRVSDLGQMEVVTASSASKTSRSELHIAALENRVDSLVEENKRLLSLISKLEKSTVTQEMYDTICQKYQMECSKSIPF